MSTKQSSNSQDEIEKKLESLYDATSKVFSLSLKLSEMQLESLKNSQRRSESESQSLLLLERQRISEHYSLSSSLQMSELLSESKIIERSELQSEIASTSIFLAESDSESLAILFKKFEAVSHGANQFLATSKALSEQLVSSEQLSLAYNSKISEFNSLISSHETTIDKLGSLSEVSAQNIQQLKEANQDLSEELAKGILSSESLHWISSLLESEETSESESDFLSVLSSNSYSVYEWYSLEESLEGASEESGEKSESSRNI